MLEKFRRLKKSGSKLIKHKKKHPEATESFSISQPDASSKISKELKSAGKELKKKKKHQSETQLATPSSEEKSAQQQIKSSPTDDNNKTNASSGASLGKPKKPRRVHLTDEQINEKIAVLKERVAALTGHENKNKRNRI